MQLTEVITFRGSFPVKKVLVENFQNSQENTPARASFLIKLQASDLQLYLKKETLAQVFSCEFCKISRNTFCSGTLSVAASVRFVRYPRLSLLLINSVL